MTDPAPAVAALVTALLRELPAADVAALVEGRARLAVVPTETSPGPTPPTATPAWRAAPTGRAAPPPDLGRARAALAEMSRRDDSTAYLAGWTARDLRALAASLELRGVAGLRKTDLVDRIVERTIGFRLNSAAIRRR
ncbi:Rho termination factor N-terminal domain-containing protein [Micromonospora deserti]|uniref:Rho termination factor-like N-terminal domain-containing protein n=1 Tax=Micromonospora deserti TaxID=2070366 RepID=A0A2W2CMS9_9ACTN|nr:Rho termination factor N-terminal domain-containing protein [Micromonospora deserti]PZG00832.1 hypothetical protein C1I99_08750 [Micromonospora deserti]